MRLAFPFVAWLVVGAVILTIAAGTTWGSGSSFWANLWLNSVAELAGLAVGVLIAVPIASRFARSRVKRVGSQVAAAVAQLRALLDEDHLNEARSAGEHKGGSISCGVCSLEVQTNGGRCSHCGLHGDHWNLPGLLSGRSLPTASQ